MTLPLLTPRLRLRGPRPADFEALYAAIWSRPEVMRFVGNDTDVGQARPRPVAVERFAWSCDLFARTGMALWTVELRDTGEIIGDCGVIPVEGRGPEIEIGYRLCPEVWGRGVATEAAAAAMGHAMAPVEAGGLGVGRLIGIVHLGNLASQRVLTKIGMRHVGTAEHYGFPHALFDTGPAAGG